MPQNLCVKISEFPPPEQMSSKEETFLVLKINVQWPTFCWHEATALPKFIEDWVKHYEPTLQNEDSLHANISKADYAEGINTMKKYSVA